jgi:hypothetical protein
MAGTFTSTRIPQDPLPWSFRGLSINESGLLGDGTTAGIRVPWQTTTSFRSGGSWDEELPTRDSLRSEDRGYNSFDTGHPFLTIRDEYRISHPNFTLRDASGTLKYQGPLIPDSRHQSVRDQDYPNISAPTDLNDLGRRAIRQTTPTNPVANLAVFFGEMREGLPSLIGLNLMRNRAGTFRELGGEYLNVQFGWKPFIADIKKTAAAVLESKKILGQYQRDSGRMVRRRFDFPVTQSVDHWGTKPGVGTRNVPNSTAWGSLFTVNSGELFESVETTRSVWFTGAYTYHLVEPNGFFERLVRYEQLSNKLLGTRLTPEVLWELAPWSWLADWVGDLGVSISNATRFSGDQLVLRYGYIMSRTRTRRVTTLRGIQPKVGSCGNLVCEFTKTRKERIKSTPYGFGLNPATFTGEQWAILAALGLTKAPRSLR